MFAPISTTKRRYPLYQELPAASQTKGVVMLDQLVTINYHNRSFQYLEQLPDDYMEKILKIVKVVFQKDLPSSFSVNNSMICCEAKIGLCFLTRS